MSNDETKKGPVVAGRQPLMEEETTAEIPVNVFKPQQHTRQMVLKQLTGPGAPRDLPLDRSQVVIGRSAQADCTIETPELSRRHIALEYDGAEFTCTDLGSQNGLYLNGVEVHSCVLRNGDTIQIGNVTFVFREASS